MGAGAFQARGQKSRLVILLHWIGNAEGFAQTNNITLSVCSHLAQELPRIPGVLQAVKGGVLRFDSCLTQSSTQYRQIRTRCYHY